MPQPLPYWAVKGTIIVPASERGQAKLDWFSKHNAPNSVRYGRVNSVGREIIHVTMHDQNGEPVGSSNLWFKYDDWSEDDWKPSELKLLEVAEPIRFTCPTCGRGHRRGYVDGVETFRCLGCGFVGKDNSYKPPEKPRTAWARVLDD